MKGVVFNLLQDAVVASFGDAAWETMLDRAGVSGVYSSLGSYPDEEMVALAQSASEILHFSYQHVLQWFGEAAMPLLALHYPQFFTSHDCARSFLLSVNDIIHPEVRKLYKGAACPHFAFHDDGPDLVIGYRSPRRLCRLAHGFIVGAAGQYGETVSVEHRGCQNGELPTCDLVVRWAH